MKVFIIILFICTCFFASAQLKTVKYNVPDSLLILKEGIYLNKQEFLTNNPSITAEFEVINKSFKDPTLARLRDKYIIIYTDSLNRKFELSADQIWGYYNGYGIFIFINKKPFEIKLLNTISFMTYEKSYKKYEYLHVPEQTPISYNEPNNLSASKYRYDTGRSYKKIITCYFDMRNEKPYSDSFESVKQIVSADSILYYNLKKDKKIKRKYRQFMFLKRFNENYPLKIDSLGIHINEASLKLD